MADSIESLNHSENSKSLEGSQKINSPRVVEDTFMHTNRLISKDKSKLDNEQIDAEGNEEKGSKESEESHTSENKIDRYRSTMLESQQNGGEIDPLARTVSIREIVKTDIMYKFPPDFELARIHGDARRVKNLDQCEYEKDKLDNCDYFCP